MQQAVGQANAVMDEYLQCTLVDQNRGLDRGGVNVGRQVVEHSAHLMKLSLRILFVVIFKYCISLNLIQIQRLFI